MRLLLMSILRNCKCIDMVTLITCTLLIDRIRRLMPSADAREMQTTPWWVFWRVSWWV